MVFMKTLGFPKGFHVNHREFTRILEKTTGVFRVLAEHLGIHKKTKVSWDFTKHLGFSQGVF